MGSKDRSNASAFVYNYFRMGTALKSGHPVERLILGSFLSNQISSPLLKYCLENFSDIKEEELNEDETLHKWFQRSGPKGKEGGWVDCNTCKDGKCKACGRKKGEKRAKYPSCRPTPAQCKTKGKGKKWGKTK